MCISDNTRRKSLLDSADTAAFLAEAMLDEESPEGDCVRSNYDPINRRSFKRMTYSSIIPKPTTMAMASALKVEDTPEDFSNRQHCVQHNYHDHADKVESMYLQKPPVSKGGVSVPFPMKLHDMLEHIQSAEPELASIVSWQPHGRCFLVHKPKEFAEHVLARFFQQKKYASFQRQLNLYGFSRITRQGPDRGSYYHEFFLRGKKFLCRGINRMKVKGTGARMASNPDAEPDFYSMSPIVPTPICKSKSSNSISDCSSNGDKSESAPQIDHLSVLDKSITSSNNASRYEMQLTNRYSNPSATSMKPVLSTSASHLPELIQSRQPEQLTNDSDLVFGNMAFHSLDADAEAFMCRRHSLMDPRSRRSSLLKNLSSSSASTLAAQRRRSSAMDMDAIVRLFQNDEVTEEEMGTVLNDIIAL